VTLVDKTTAKQGWFEKNLYHWVERSLIITIILK